jgi:hypothetical protein
VVSVEQLASILGRHRYNFTNEAELQEGVAEVLTGAGVAFEREVRITDRDRLDFLVGAVAVEVKIQGGAAPLIRQLGRYAALDRVEQLFVVTSRTLLARMPKHLNGKPITGVIVRGGM